MCHLGFYESVIVETFVNFYAPGSLKAPQKPISAHKPLNEPIR